MSAKILNPKFPTLATPVKVGGIQLSNRFVMASLTRNRAVPTSVPNEHNLEYYVQRAQGGVGLIMTEAILISQQGAEWPHAPGLYTSEHVKAWKKITDAVHAEGTPIVAQLWQIGRVGHPETNEAKLAGKPVYAPSALAARGGKFRELGGKGYTVPKEMTIAEIKDVIGDYKKAAENAKLAGFDGVEFHSANGYLPHQFLDSSSNKRTDAYGGSVENRTRFGLEVISALIEVWGADRVGIKISPGGGYNDMGMPLEDTLATFTHYISSLDKLGLGWIQLSRFLEYLDPRYDGTVRGTAHDIWKTYSPLINHAALLMNGDYTPEEAEKAISANEFTAVVMGRKFISSPDYVRRAQLGLGENALDFRTLYDGAPEVWNGYTDYPFADESKTVEVTA